MQYKNINGSISLENPNVQKIIEIAKELIKQNKVLRVKKLYNIAIKCLEIPSGAILEILQFLINYKILIDGSKLTKDTILMNLYRRKIYNVIEKYDGATFSFLREKVFTDHSGSAGQLIWHLKMLLKFRYIKKLKVGNYSLFLPIDMENDAGKLSFFMKNTLNKKFIYFFKNHEETKKSEVYKMINFKRENVNYRLKVLIEHEILIYNDLSTNKISISKRMKELL
ncbi:hypothetical protein LCGC14_1589300 [marine sediment metagenome]|uniref:Uncharacterized protein n=1 Tax=marine sediment metagenome TaxID=412755 RepID=A0A0F9LEW8_9ZZZZ